MPKRRNYFTMKKLIFTAILAVSAVTAASAQIKVDVIRLENGKTLKGEIVARSDSSVYFRTADGTLSKQIDCSDIADCSQETLSKWEYRMLRGYVRGAEMPKNYIPSSRKSGYGAFVEALGGGFSGMYYGWFDITTSHGYYFTPRTFVGGGTGVNLKIAYTDRYYSRAPRMTSMCVPVFATARHYFINSRNCSPYIDGKIGYAIPLYDAVGATGAYENRHLYQSIRTRGLYFNISVGVELNRVTIAAGLTGAESEEIDFNEEIYIDYPGMRNRWNNYSAYYRYMDTAWHLSVGYRF